MEYLELIHRILVRIGFCAPKDETSRFLSTFFVFTGFAILQSISCAFASTIAFIVEFGKDDMGDFFSAIFASISTGLGCYMVVSTMLFRDTNKSIFDELQNIYDECKLNRFFNRSIYFNRILLFLLDQRTESFKHLMRANTQSEKITRIFVYIMACGYIVISVSMAAMNLIVCYRIDEYVDPECLIVPYKIM